MKVKKNTETSVQKTLPIKKIVATLTVNENNVEHIVWNCENISRLELIAILWQGLQSFAQTIGPAVINEHKS